MSMTTHLDSQRNSLDLAAVLSNGVKHARVKARLAMFTRVRLLATLVLLAPMLALRGLGTLVVLLRPQSKGDRRWCLASTLAMCVVRYIFFGGGVLPLGASALATMGLLLVHALVCLASVLARRLSTALAFAWSASRTVSAVAGGSEYDVVIVGAGLSGIAAAYYLRTFAPAKRFVLLESRAELGGTWSLHTFPGIRSDSEMYTLSFSFFPWTAEQAIADGAQIFAYLAEAARTFGIAERIRFNTRCVAADWSSQAQRWTITTQTDTRFVACHMFCCAGYYDYEQAYTPDFPGARSFAGTVVHPQHWPAELSLAGKRVVVVGSGATAVTLVPELAKLGAAQVTMLQRTPTFVVNRPRVDPLAALLRRKLRLPEAAVCRIMRLVSLGKSLFEYALARVFPHYVRELILAKAATELGSSRLAHEHFNAPYAPWDQRICVSVDGEMFHNIRDGVVHVVTDTIARLEPAGVRLAASGALLPADVLVSATGLRLQLLGGLVVRVDGEVFHPSEHVAYRGVMFDRVPNCFVFLGYPNASWTLRAELVAQFCVRVLQHLDAHALGVAVPARAPEGARAPWFDLTSGYIQRARNMMPQQIGRHPWRASANHAVETSSLALEDLDDGVLQFLPDIRQREAR